MKKVIKEQEQQETVFCKDAKITKIYIHVNDDGGLWKLCKIGLGDYKWSWADLKGTYTTRLETYQNIKHALRTALEENKQVLEFDNFNDFIEYFYDNKICIQ